MRQLSNVIRLINPMIKDMDKAQLITKRDELRARLEAIEKDYRKGLDPDSKERAVQLENADVLTGISKAISEELKQIEEQLSKLP